jgi:hypothetical protein
LELFKKAMAAGYGQEEAPAVIKVLRCDDYLPLGEVVNHDYADI